MRRILVADDEPYFQELIRETLEADYSVETTGTSREALTLARTTKPDLIILDMDMPDSRGADSCRELKNDPETKSIPLILLTRRSDRDLMIEGLYAGADDYVCKPIHAPELLARIKSHLRSKECYSDLDRDELFLLLELYETISSSRNPVKILDTIVNKMADVIEVERCSIVSIDASGEVRVRASNDLSYGSELTLNLAKYPEIEYALTHRTEIVVNDIKRDPMMEHVREDVQDLEFKSIVVVPIIRNESVIGTFFLRTAHQLPESEADKVLRLCRLVANVSANSLENAILFESLETARYCLEEMAERDGLTGLLNHQTFYTRLEHELSRAKRYDTDLSCIFVDVDDFKQVNDVHGHLAGDDVLKQIARVMRHAARESDIIGRYGGDEFVVVLPQTSSDGATDLARRIHEQVREIRIKPMVSHRVSISVGVATLDRDVIMSADELVQLTDGAMYGAKKLGKDQIHVLGSPHGATATEPSDAEVELARKS